MKQQVADGTLVIRYADAELRQQWARERQEREQRARMNVSHPSDKVHATRLR
jgi:hypothetical protein